MRRERWAAACVAGLLGVALAVGGARGQYGAILSGTGAVNRGFAGVATAAPISSAGALFWNPATLTGLPRSELEAGAELLFPHTTASSSVPANAFGAGAPPVPLHGRSRSDADVYGLPSIGLAYVPDDSIFAYGLGVFALAGFGVDYPASRTNPLATAPPPAGVGFGSVYSDYQVLQIAPAMAVRVTDRLSVAAGPTLNLATLRVDPGLFAPVDDANGNGFASYPRASHGRAVWGAGFTVGAYYEAETWAVGASVKSPQWFDSYRFNSTDEVGRPREPRLDLTLPLIASVGASYRGIDRWLLAADVRWVDYASTEFLGQRGLAANGAVGGLGWRSIWTAAAAAEYRVSDALAVRGGYSFGESPIPNGLSQFNTVAPTMIKHALYAGLSWDVTEDFRLSLGYVHAFQNAVTGPVLTGAGPVARSAVRNTAAADAVLLSATVRFGGPR